MDEQTFGNCTDSDNKIKKTNYGSNIHILFFIHSKAKCSQADLFTVHLILKQKAEMHTSSIIGQHSISN
jgi:hypothetical protein